MAATADLEDARREAGVGPDDPWPPEDESSVAERAEREPTQEEMFPLGAIEGDGKTVKNLMRGGLPVEVTVAMMSAEVPSPSGGLLDPEKGGQLVVSIEPAKYLMIPKREGEPGAKRLVGWKVRQQVRPTYVQSGQLFTREQVLDILFKVGVPESADIIPELLGDG